MTGHTIGLGVPQLLLILILAILFWALMILLVIRLLKKIKK